MKSRFLQASVLLLLVFTGCSTSSFLATDRLKVDSNPAGAEVWVNGEKRGTTPVELSLVSTDVYELQLRREGFRTERVTVYSHLSQNAKTGVRVNPLVSRGYYSSLIPNPVEVNLISTLIPENPNAPKTWEEFSLRLNELDRWLAQGRVSDQNHRLIKRQLIEFYE